MVNVMMIKRDFSVLIKISWSVSPFKYNFKDWWLYKIIRFCSLKYFLRFATTIIVFDSYSFLIFVGSENLMRKGCNK